MSRTPRILVEIGIGVLAFAVGAAVGVITTFTHRQLPPWGLIAGLLIVAALIAGLRLAFEGRLAAGAAALGVLLAVAVLSLQTSGGSVLIAGDALGVVWGVGPTLVAAVAVAWPRPRPRPVPRPEAPSDTE
ncbi:hypothetical protein [Protaetiibacter larvae]|uniref:Histidinol dehydrogenase n=1 Tax=Protaetiibacter larvae TaxID=2592654 RepID=A0A5C1Y6S7_9MICO|nr:hypothetical protein [Protaetiibacter larvae]QEO09614.1 hypothetical protein FLP23_06115 [Protaetiibacter larvae]